jgi:hypothetical protein
MKKFSEIFTYIPLSKYEGLHGSLVCRAPTTYLGVEIELEQVNWKKSVTVIPKSFYTTEDNSLKANGKEFITKPLRFCYLEQELRRIFKSITPPLMSSRCSIHVHMNARDFTHMELAKFILLYSIFEKGMFNFANKKFDRWNNIFCTPLYSFPETVINTLMTCRKEAVTFHWHKYFAMNISPIFGGETKHLLGTVEFRHMEATDDIEHIIEWCNLIVSLKLAAKKMDLEHILNYLQQMNQDSSYVRLTELVFGNWSKYFFRQETFKKDIESCITKTKYCAGLAGYLPQTKHGYQHEIPLTHLERA